MISSPVLLFWQSIRSKLVPDFQKTFVPICVYQACTSCTGPGTLEAPAPERIYCRRLDQVLSPYPIIVITSPRIGLSGTPLYCTMIELSGLSDGPHPCHHYLLDYIPTPTVTDLHIQIFNCQCQWNTSILHSSRPTSITHHRSELGLCPTGATFPIQHCPMIWMFANLHLTCVSVNAQSTTQHEELYVSVAWVSIAADDQRNWALYWKHRTMIYALSLQIISELANCQDFCEKYDI